MARRPTVKVRVPPLSPKSLGAFVQAKRQKNCMVCNTVPAELRQQINEISKSRRFTVSLCLEWLQAEHGITITLEQWRNHSHARPAHL